MTTTVVLSRQVALYLIERRFNLFVWHDLKCQTGGYIPQIHKVNSKGCLSKKYSANVAVVYCTCQQPNLVLLLCDYCVGSWYMSYFRSKRLFLSQTVTLLFNSCLKLSSDILGEHTFTTFMQIHLVTCLGLKQIVPYRPVQQICPKLSFVLVQ